ncbi:MAG: DUF3078 domain-containing protein [Bacteroidales bacterium]
MMRKIHLSIAIVALVVSTAFGQDAVKDTSYWSKTLVNTLTFSQTSFSNWSGGGDNSLTLSGILDYKLNYEKGKSVWDNNLIMGYGVNKLEGERIKKSDDRLEFSTKYGYSKTKKLKYSALFDFKTQFDKGYDSDNDSLKVSNFMAPAYISVGLGIDWRPKKWLSVFASPLSTKLTFVLDEELSDKGSFGLDPGEKFRAELGTTIKAEATKEILKNVNVSSTLTLFSNYLEKPQNIDVNWDTRVNMKVNKYMSANFNINLVYDDDIDIEDKNGHARPILQVKEIFGIGLTATF